MRNEAALLEDPLVVSWMRDSILWNLVASNHSDKEEWHRKLALLNLNSYFVMPSIALFECSMTLTDELLRLKENERIISVVQQHMPEGSIIFKDGEARIVLLFSWESLATLRSLTECLPSAYPVNIGVGGACKQLKDIYMSYEQALQALQDKFYQGTGQMILFSELNKYETLRQYPSSQEKLLYQRIKSVESLADIEQGIGEFYEQLLKNGPVGINQIHELTIRLLAGMEKRMLGDTRESLTSMRYEMMSIVKMETLRDIVHFVAMYLFDRREGLARDDRESHRSIIKKTIFYMEQECQIATLDSMARKVYMTPTYLSMLFKVNTGITFIEQLTDIRIGKAKELLRETGLRNYEIAEKIGYHDSRYFSQLFKKKVGLSPSEYRESVEV
jgi:two-component system response regulator YesN